MKAKRKTDGIIGGEVRYVVKGIITSCILTVLLSALMGILVLNDTVPERGGRYGAMIVGIISAAGGSIVAIGRRREKRLLLGTCLGAAYLLLLVSMNALFFDGRYQRVGEMVLGVLGTCLLFGMLYKQRKNTAKRRRK